MRSLEKSPASRYQTATEILDDLQNGKASSGTTTSILIPVVASASVTPPHPHSKPRFEGRTVQIQLPKFTERRWIWPAAGVLVLSLGAFAIPGVRHMIHASKPGPATSVSLVSGVPPLQQGNFLAILPFRVLGDATSLDYVADGLNEAISAKLFQLKDVRLTSAAAAAKVSDKDPLDKIARELGANLLVTGTVQGSGDGMRIIVNLDDVPDGKRVWSQEFSGVSKDVLSIEDQISAQLVSALAVKPADEEISQDVRSDAADGQCGRIRSLSPRPPGTPRSR